jgi:hypothetical protein
MPIFGQLHEDAFLIFSRANRQLYARLVVDLFERFFSDTVTFPGRLEVIGHIYDTLKSRPELWADEGEDFSNVADIRLRGRRIRRTRIVNDDGRQDLLMQRAQRVYWQFVEKGWLEEESYGIRTTVDMPPAAMLLAERLASIEKGLATTFRGVVITIRNALASVHQDPKTNALGLNKAAEMALKFSRELRAVLSHLRSIERSILDAGNLNQRLATFFEEFIGRLVLKDFESIYKTNHPYRFKRSILEYVERVSEEGSIRDQVVDGYIDGELAADRAAAGQTLDQDLFTVRTVFDNIDQTYERINGFRIRLESRLRNTVKYAELGDRRHSQLLSRLIGRFDSILSGMDTAEAERRPILRQPEGLVIAYLQPWAPHLLAEPRAPRQPVQAGTLRRPRPDPVLDAWRHLLRDYNDMFIVDAGRVTRFLESRILPDASGEARWLRIETVEDFLAFEQLRRFRHKLPPAMAEQFEFLPCPEAQWRDDEWLKCRNFLIRRKPEELRGLGEAQ